MVPPSDKNENCVVQLKEQSLMKNSGVPASERDNNLIKKTDIQTPCFRSYSRSAMYDLPQTLHEDTARWDHRNSYMSFF